MIVSPVIPVYSLKKKSKIKTVSVLVRVPCPLAPSRSLNWLNGRGRANNFDVDCRDGCTKK